MLFSVVIPTHNRLEILRGAVETVRRQRETNWELVVFDNASADDIASYVRSLNDSRIVYRRSETFLPVTDSWNAAIDLAKGDYVTFLGDDDGLTPGYFNRIGLLVEEFDSPEVIYCALYQFLHPGVAPWEPRGYLADVKNGFFFVGRDKPFRMSLPQASKAVRGSINLRRNFTFNIQAFVFSRSLLARLHQDGPIFRSPFPDYYLANVALAKSGSTVVVPEPLVIAGVCKASFGFTLFNGLEQEGAALLNSKLKNDSIYAEVERKLLPGPLYNTNYIVTMERVARDVAPLTSSGANFGRYRRLQILALVAGHLGPPWRPSPAGPSFWPQLSAAEKVWAACLAILLYGSSKFRCRTLAAAALRRLLGPYAFRAIERICNRGGYLRLIEIYEALEKGEWTATCPVEAAAA